MYGGLFPPFLKSGSTAHHCSFWQCILKLHYFPSFAEYTLNFNFQMVFARLLFFMFFFFLFFVVVVVFLKASIALFTLGIICLWSILYPETETSLAGE